MTLNDGQESREVTPLNASVRNYRAAMGTASIEATFLNDPAYGSIENELRSCLLMQNYPQLNHPTSSHGMTAALAGLGAGNLLPGAYNYYATYVFSAFESAPSTAATITVVTSSGNGQVALSSIPVSTGYATGTSGFCKARNIYRSQTANGSSSTAVYLTQIADNTTTIYTDNASSSTLVSAASMSKTWTVTGFPVVVRKYATAQGASNPNYTLTALVDGDINLLDSKPGDIDQ